jgi:3-hydroxybutyryl-CoA dehydrogenase
MGPFELLDLTGLDVSGRVMQSIYDQFQQDPRYRPSSLIPPRIAAGLYGRKSGRGFYAYRDGVKDEAPPQPAPACAPGTFWTDQVFAAPGATQVDDPADAEVLLLHPWGEDVTAAATRLRLDPEKAVGIDQLIAPDRRQVLMVSPATSPKARDLAHGWLAAQGPVTLIADSPGFIAQRVLAMIVNIGCELAQRRIACPVDIDAAVRIGLGYPLGPLEWGDRIGARRVLAILERLQALTGDPRYRPSQWLRRRALLGLPLVEDSK